MRYEDYGHVPGITPSSTSYFSAPSSQLDPKLFVDTHLRGWVREGILGILFGFLSTNFNSPHSWTKAWLAGSGVSYQWEASREPGDLDCLVGIDYVKFRQMNTEYAGYSNQDIASMFNERFNAEIMPSTSNWEGYELTFYVNPQSDIRDINPYAAYDLIAYDWTVEPERNPQPPYSRDWEHRANRDHATAEELLKRHNNALNDVRSATNPAYRVNAEKKLKLAQDQAIAFYDDIHKARKIAFSQVGSGYSDFNNYRWQAGKRSGAIQALRAIKDIRSAQDTASQVETYGITLPNADTLLRRNLRG
jgi:hypothetical protein